MLSFKKYIGIIGDIARKLKISKDEAVNALMKAIEKGVNPLKWQQNLSVLSTFVTQVSEVEPTKKNK